MTCTQLFLYDNRLRNGTLSASSTYTGVSGLNVVNLLDFRAFTWWRADTLPATATVDCLVPLPADYGLVYAQPGTYEVRGSSDNFSASNVLLGTITLSSEGLGLVLFASQSFRYYRVAIPGAGTPPYMAIAAVGARLTPPAGMPYGYDPIGRKVRGTFNRSEAGHPIGRIVEFDEFSASVQLPWVTWTWLRQSWIPAWNAWLRAEPFVFVWDAENHPDEARIVMIKDDWNARHRTPIYADLDFEIMGRI